MKAEARVFSGAWWTVIDHLKVGGPWDEERDAQLRAELVNEKLDHAYRAGRDQEQQSAVRYLRSSYGWQAAAAAIENGDHRK